MGVLVAVACDAGPGERTESRLEPVEGGFLADLCSDGATAWGGEPPTAYVFECRQKDGTRDGVFRTWYPDGVRRDVGGFAEGKREGLWSHYHRHGQKISEGRYSRGERDGQWSFWHKSGRLREKVWFRDGAIDRWQRAGHGP